MATTRDRNPSGELILKDYWHESASGHAEESEIVKVIAIENQNKLKLQQTIERSNTFKMGSDDKIISNWEIEASELIKLIKENGKKV